MSLVGVPTSSLSCGPSCKEGLQDTLGGDAPNASGPTRTAVASGPGRYCLDDTDCAGAPGISSVHRHVSSASKASWV